MAYCTIDDVKSLWFPNKNWTTNENNELENLINEASSDIDHILEQYTPLPLPTSLANKLKYICAEWAAGRFRQNRGYKNDAKDRPSVAAAYERLLKFIETQFKKSFMVI